MSNFTDWLLGGTGGRERRDTLALYNEAAALHASAPLANEHARGTFLVEMIHTICDKLDVSPSMNLGEALFSAMTQLLYADGFLINLPDVDVIDHCTMEEGIALREAFRRSIRVHKDHDRLLVEWITKIRYLFIGILRAFPTSAFVDPDEDAVDEDKVEYIVFPNASACDLCENLGDVIESTMATFGDQFAIESGLFRKVRFRMEDNLLRASNIPLSDRDKPRLKLKFASEQIKMRPDDMVEVYLQGTPFYDFFQTQLPFAIPFPARFEHTHIVGGSGHGKTQLLQFLINHDLVRAKDDGRSVVVIDGQGDLIRTISHLAHFDPDVRNSLAERLVIVDPTDIENPVSLNMFDFDMGRLETLSPKDREMTLNAAVETFEFFFGALLGAELTQRQGVIFRYIARLMMEIPDATIHTLRELMENGEKFRPNIEKLTGTTRHFFETQFFERQFNETKKQILARLWGVLSNATIERMFSHTENKVNLFRLLNEGKIVLISTAKDFLGHDGACILGRFFISLIAQAALQRATLKPYERNPALVYVDEAEDYFDASVGRILNQARKYKIGIHNAHQNLDQTDTALRATLLSSTSIKFAGGLSSKDANTLDSEFHTDAAFLLGQKKHATYTEFACYVRNYTTRALSVRIPLGYVESLPTMSDSAYERLLGRIRKEYCAPPMEPNFDHPQVARKAEPPSRKVTPTPPTERQDIEPKTTPKPTTPRQETAPVTAPIPEPVREATTAPRIKPPPKPKAAPEQGRGGKQHKYLQQLIKQLADARGFRASIEEVILDGAGKVDVSLVRGERRIACEISVTTGRDHEFSNIEKCLAAGYTEILMVGVNERHVRSLTKFIDENLEEADRGKVRYAVPEELTEYLESLGEPPPPTETMVRGYTVRTKQKVIDPKEAEARKQAIAEVLARSMRKSKDT